MNRGEAIDAADNIVGLAEQAAALCGFAKGTDYDLNVVFSFKPETADKVVEVDPGLGIPQVLAVVQVTKPGEDEPTVAIFPCLTLTYFKDEDVLARLAMMLSGYIQRVVSDQEHHTIEMLYTVENLTDEEAATAKAAVVKLSRIFAEGLDLAVWNADPSLLDQSGDRSKQSS